MPRRPNPPLYATWASMLDRCRNERCRYYKNYGGRGIYVCERWKNFRLFEADMGPKPGPKYSIDRIDNNGPYSPENCRWATRYTQNRNKSDNRFITVDGESHLLVDLAERFGLSRNTILYRANKGLSYSEIVSPHRRIDSSGLSKAREAMKRIRETITHCKKGHEYAPDNIVWDKNGWRLCKVCYDANARRKAERRRFRATAAVPAAPA